MLTFEELKDQGLLAITDEPCEHCKESKDRDTRYLIVLPTLTKNLSLKTRVCPTCDGESLIEKAYRPRNEQEEQGIS